VRCFLFPFLTGPVNVSSTRFILYPRPKAGRRDHAAFKIKNILKGDETDGTLRPDPFHSVLIVSLVSRQDLIHWLRQEISEQKRLDVATAGAPIFSDTSASVSSNKPATSIVQPVLPVTDTKKQRKQVKHLFEERGSLSIFWCTIVCS
jgi:translation initiation factor 2-alpha kinase 4